LNRTRDENDVRQGFVWLEARTSKGTRPHALDLSFEAAITAKPRFDVNTKNVVITFTKVEEGEWLGLPNAKRPASKKAKKKKSKVKAAAAEQEAVQEDSMLDIDDEEPPKAPLITEVTENVATMDDVVVEEAEPAVVAKPDKMVITEQPNKKQKPKSEAVTLPGLPKDGASLAEVLTYADAASKATEAAEAEGLPAPQLGSKKCPEPREPDVLIDARTLMNGSKASEVLKLLDSDALVTLKASPANGNRLVEASALQLRAHAMVRMQQWDDACDEFAAARDVFKTVYQQVGWQRDEVLGSLTGDVTVILAAVRISSPMTSCIAAIRGEAMTVEAHAQVVRQRAGKNVTMEVAKDAVILFGEARMLFAKVGDVPNSGQAAYNAAKLHFNHGDPAAAASAAASAATSFILVNQPGQGAAAMRLQGLAKAKMGDIKAASELLQASMQVGAENKIPEQVALSAMALAEMMPNCDDQRTGYQSAAGAFKAAQMPEHEARALTKLAESILQNHLENPQAWKASQTGEYDDDTGPVDKAVENLDRAMSILSKGSDAFAKADCHMTFT